MTDQDPRDRVLVEVPRWSADLLFQPAGRVLVVLGAVALAGLALVGIGAQQVAAQDLVPFQVPWLVSAGMVGVALTVTAVALGSIHLQRRAAAAARLELDRISDGLVVVTETLDRWAAARWGSAPTGAAATRSSRGSS